MKIASLTSPKTNLTYSLHPGIGKSQINELVTYTLNEPDPLVHASTADWQGGQGRFASGENFGRWVAQGRTIYTLLDQTQALSGIIWFGQRPLPSEQFILPADFDPVPYGLTIGVRLYGPARGAGLSAEFARHALAHFFQHSAYTALAHPGLWLETGVDNQASLALAHKLGFEDLAISANHQRVLLVFPAQP